MVVILWHIYSETTSEKVFQYITINEPLTYDSETGWNIPEYSCIYTSIIAYDEGFLYVGFGLWLFQSLLCVCLLLYIIKHGDNYNPFEYSVCIILYIISNNILFITCIKYWNSISNTKHVIFY